MSYYAKVLNGIVTNIIIAEPDFMENEFIDTEPGTWIKTSFNVRGGVYFDPETNEPHPDQETIISAEDGRQRKNFAWVGSKYSHEHDAFEGQKIYPSWILNTETFLYEAPIDKPNDGLDYYWDEDNESWVIVPDSDGS